MNFKILTVWHYCYNHWFWFALYVYFICWAKIAHCQVFFVKDYGTVLRGNLATTDVILLALFNCVSFCLIFVWESYLRCLPFQILYNELRLHWLYKLPIEPPGKHLYHFYHLFIFCSLLIFRLIWNKYSNAKFKKIH